MISNAPKDTERDYMTCSEISDTSLNSQIDTSFVNKIYCHLKNTSVLLLILTERPSLPYCRSFFRTIFERLLICITGCINCETSERRSRRWTSNDEQSSKECPVSSIPSFVEHIGFTVSLKLCLNLWKFRVLIPTLNCER